MDMSIILQMLVTKFPAASIILLLLGALVVLAQALVPLLPQKEQDEWAKIQSLPVIGKLISALIAFAPIQKKDPKALS